MLGGLERNDNRPWLGEGEIQVRVCRKCVATELLGKLGDIDKSNVCRSRVKFPLGQNGYLTGLGNQQSTMGAGSCRYQHLLCTVGRWIGPLVGGLAAWLVPL